jgi:hypothetical protein
MAGDAPEPFEVRVRDDVLEDLRGRLARTRWPSQPVEESWGLVPISRTCALLAEHWAARYDWRAFEDRLNELSNRRWNGLHVIWERSEGEGCRSSSSTGGRAGRSSSWA